MPPCEPYALELEQVGCQTKGAGTPTSSQFGSERRVGSSKEP
jgi:hypothetical protein